MNNSWRRQCRGGLILLFAVLLFALRTDSTAIVDISTIPEADKHNEELAAVRLSEVAKESIANLDDHPVEDNDAARADRMLAALETIPEDERSSFGLDLEALRSKPLEERLNMLQELWAVRQEELREAYDAMPKVNELLNERIDALRDEDASDEMLVLTLTDLEDLVSDIDMARDFHSVGGFSVLSSMLDESRSEAVRETAAWVIGTAVKNEPQHQLWVLEVGPQHQPSTLASLLENAAIASTNSLRGKVLYALSACLSNNGDVQLQFGSMRGEAVLSAMYDADGSDSRVRTKTLTLMSDLLSEAARGSPAAVLGVMPVGTSSASGGAWCRRADERLQQASTLAHIEKAVEAVASFAPSCASQFKALGTKERLDGLAQQCRVSAQTGSAEEELEFHEELAHKLEECAVSLR